MQQECYCACCPELKMKQYSLFVLGFAIAFPVWAENKNSIAEIERRLNSSNVATVNTYLSKNWDTKMAALLAEVEECNVKAIKLSIRLLDTTNLEALAAHRFSLEIAIGECPEKVLSIAPLSHINELCTINAYMEKFPDADPLQTIDRRISVLQRVPASTFTPELRTCIEAYEGVRKQYLNGDK